MSYRVFDLKNREWADPDKILISCGENKLLTCGNAVFGWRKLKELPEDKYLFHKSLGIVDKHGVELYEGDICAVDMPEGHEDGDTITVEVAYIKERAGYFMFDWEHSKYYSFGEGLNKIIEVIGNVCDDEPNLENEVDEA